VPIIHGDDRRRLVPETMLKLIALLLDELHDAPSEKRVELRTMAARLARLYGLQAPQDAANASELAQQLEDEDGVPLED